MESPTTYQALATHLHTLLEAECYSKTTMKDMEFILDSFTAYMIENDLAEYTPVLGERLVEYCEKDLRVCPSRVTRAKVIVRKLNRLHQGLGGRDALWGNKALVIDIPNNFRESLDAHILNCKENGNKQTTLRHKQWICGKFLKVLADLGCEDSRDISGELVQMAFLQLGVPRYWERIGPFLRFLFENGFMEHNYSKLIPYRKRNSHHPTVYSTAEIAAVEGSIDRNTPAGIRNYAIILLLSRYGIRSRDIAALSFENIDFSNNRIHFIQQKTGDPWECELFPEVKAALRNYIQNVRPEIEGRSQVFMTLTIPYKPVDCRVINTMVWETFRKSGITIAERRHGSRAFRSSIASNMINDDVSTEVVRRVLGHGTKHAIKHYAKIDVESMRLCPLPVPPPSGIFAELLSWKGGVGDV